MINRSVLVLRAKPPYWAWVRETQRRLTSGMYIPSEHDPDMTAHLIPPVDTQQEFEWQLRSIYRPIFEAELLRWCEDKSLWPKKRTLAMFRTWFHMDLHTMVVDHGDESLYRVDPMSSGISGWLLWLLAKLKGY